MDAFDWFHLLTPLAFIIMMANVLAGAALKPEYRSARVKKYSLIGYSGIIIGWSIMRLGTALTSVSLITKICLIGWLILMPALVLIAGCFVTRLAQDKLHFSTPSRQIVNFIGLSIKAFIVVMAKLLAYTLCFFLDAKKRPEHQTEVSESTFDETVGGPHVFTKNPEGLFGEEYSHSSHDPCSPWSSR